MRLFENEIESLTKKIKEYKDNNENEFAIKLLEEKKEKLNDKYKSLTNLDRFYLARHRNRPRIKSFISNIFSDFVELSGDRYYGDDLSIIGGIAKFKDENVTILGNNRSFKLEENIKMNFGMSTPEGYRKAIRLIKQAEKFNRPIITFVDTPGAYPGKEAEERGQFSAIANSIYTFLDVNVPIISFLIGEGGSGGALALCCGNEINMLEHSVLSILSPEGYSSIVFKDNKHIGESSDLMRCSSKELQDLKIIDNVIKENLDFDFNYYKEVYNEVDKLIFNFIKRHKSLSKNRIKEEKYMKFRRNKLYGI